MKCPVCGKNETKAKKTVDKVDFVKRYRICLACGAKFNTKEVFDCMTGERHAKKDEEEETSQEDEDTVKEPKPKKPKRSKKKQKEEDDDDSFTPETRAMIRKYAEELAAMEDN